MSRRLVLPLMPPLYGVEALPGFELTFTSAGHTFKAFVRAKNIQAATHEAICELAYQCPEFEADSARLMAAVQVA